jgi:hypothetical protein
VAGFEYELDAKKLGFLIGRFPKELAKALRTPMLRAVKWFKKKHRIARLSGPPGLQRRTGDLIRSFVPGVSPPGTGISDLESWLATRSKYAGIHEEGKVGLRSDRPGGYLTIPITPEYGGQALTAGGVLKGKYTDLRSVPGMFVKKSKKGNLILFEKVGKGIVPQFVLKKSVDIPPRLRFFDMFRRWTGALKKRFLAPVIEKAWIRAGAKR